MKQILLSTMALLLSLTAFSQQIDLVNNTGQPLHVYFRVTGTDPGCTACNDFYKTDTFTISTGTTTLNSFTDFDTFSPQIRLHRGPGGVASCPPAGCTGSSVASTCGQPVWQMIGFSYPGAPYCCLWRVGNTSCGYTDTFFDSNSSYNVHWNVVSPSLIVVEFNP